ncbi:hypothetical protein QF024_003361 [Chryseobacterium nepalense]|nr:hypothetical protein [Chryseobacterium nepalense]
MKNLSKMLLALALFAALSSCLPRPPAPPRPPEPPHRR